MYQVRIAQQKVWVDDTPIALISGEMHYWRLAPETWRLCLQRIKEMGLQMVATYICWDFHELNPGEYDFDGRTDPRRNLVAFLELVAAEGLWLIIRPGPYIYSEWRNGGVPDHAAVYHRLHSEFQKKALTYLQVVVPLLIPYLATNGGPILLLQADNEIDPWPQWYTEALGLGASVGSFQQFLRERYATLEALNHVWRTYYTDFDAIRAQCTLLDSTPEHTARYLDYCRFRHWYVNQVATWSVEIYRQLGVDVPICLNTYSGVSTQLPAAMEQIADLVGADLYPSREFALRPEEHRGFMDLTRYLPAYSKLPYIAEFGAGIWHDWLAEVGILTPNHYRLVCLSALLTGIVGWNWYMLVNRDNWSMSPINEWGRTHPDLFAAFQQLTTLFNTIDPPTLTRLVDTALTFDPLQKAAARPAQDLSRAFYEAGIDYRFYDPNVGNSTQSDAAQSDAAQSDAAQSGGVQSGGVPSLLFYAGTYWLSAAAQDKLAEYVENGGHLICLSATFPRFDDTLYPLNCLQIMEPSGVIEGPGQGLRLRLSGLIPQARATQATINVPWLAHYTPSVKSPQTPIMAERLPTAIENIGSEEERLRVDLQSGTLYQVGYTEKRGKGRLTVLGLPPTCDLLLALHSGRPNAALCALPGVSSALFQRDDVFYVIIVNNGEEAKAIDIRLQLDVSILQVQDLIRGNTFQIDTRHGAFVITLPRKDGTVLQLTPQKITPQKDTLHT